jgi:hypothetical protein
MSEPTNADEVRTSERPAGAERRVHPRYDLLAQIAVRHGSVDHVLEILNLSRGGALVDLARESRPRWLDLGRQVEVRVLGLDGATVLEAEGRVVRIVENLDTRTFAVQFDALVDDDVVREVLRAAGRPPPLPHDP